MRLALLPPEEIVLGDVVRKVSRVFLAAWTASTVIVMIVYPHHLLMDLAMPTWARILGQVAWYASGFLLANLLSMLGVLASVPNDGHFGRQGDRATPAATRIALSPHHDRLRSHG